MLWTEKYRPETLDDVIGNEYIVASFHKFLSTGSVPHILLHGPSGIGKTSMIKAFTNTIFGKDLRSKVLHVNASDERGIRYVREVITEFISTQQTLGSQQPVETTPKEMGSETCLHRVKVVILEEVDSMTLDAQFCLRRLLETHADRARFFMTGNRVNSLITALRSRCCEYSMCFLTDDQVGKQIDNICIKENIQTSPRAKRCLISYSNGDLRKAISCLQNISTCFQNSIIDTEVIRHSLGVIPSEDIQTFLSSISDWDDVKDGRDAIGEFLQNNDIDISHFVNAIFLELEQFIYEVLCDENLLNIPVFLSEVDNLASAGATSTILTNYMAVGLFKYFLPFAADFREMKRPKF